MSKPLLSISKIMFRKNYWGFSEFEFFFFIFSVILVAFSSLYKHDSLFAVVSAACGIIYTILAGKGKVYCYFFGIVGTLCCAYVSYDILLFGNFALHLLYYFPMEVIGFFTWKKHLNRETNEVIKERLSAKDFATMISLIITFTLFLYLIFVKIGDKSPMFDSLITVLSVAGMILTVKRSIEQWLIWTLVNFLSIIMWFDAYMDGEKIFSIFVVRILYFVLGLYFFVKWKNESIKRAE